NGGRSIVTRSGTAISIKGLTSVSRWKQKTTSTRSFATWSGMPCVPTSWSERNRGVGRVCAVWSAKTRCFPSSRRALCLAPPIGCKFSSDGSSLTGALAEEHREQKSKPGNQRIALQVVTHLKNLHTGRRFVDLDLARHWIGDPDLPNPCVKVLLDLAGHLVGRVALADHLDGQVGDHVPGLGPGDALADGPPLGRNEGEGGATLEL